MNIINSSSQELVVDKVLLCNGYFSRMKGLLGKASLEVYEACIIKPCSQVHTVGMKFSIDVYFVDKHGTIIKVIKDLKPYRMSPLVFGSHYVIERMAGHESVGAIGDKLKLLSP